MIDLTTIIISKNRHTLSRALDSCVHSTETELVFNYLSRDTPLDEQTRSLSRLRNTAVYSANTEYVNFLDDDDYFLPGYHEAATELADSKPDVILMSASGLHIPIVADKIRGYLAGLESIPPGSLIIRKALYMQLGGFNETLAHSEGWEFYLRLFKTSFDLKVNNEGLWYFTRSLDSMGINQVNAYGAKAITDWRRQHLWLNQ